jgi:hypothetical protein
MCIERGGGQCSFSVFCLAPTELFLTPAVLCFFFSAPFQTPCLVIIEAYAMKIHRLVVQEYEKQQLHFWQSVLAPLKGSLRVSDMFASRAVDTTVKKI